jgi:hypothetical protein
MLAPLPVSIPTLPGTKGDYFAPGIEKQTKKPAKPDFAMEETPIGITPLKSMIMPVTATDVPKP